MTSYIYKPECYLANERGMVEKNEEYYMWLSMHERDNRAIIGNQVVEFRFSSDTMEPTRHMCNGRMYTSKKLFRDETRARGCIEIGNETKAILNSKPKVHKLDKKKRREDIKRALWEVRNGRDIKKEMREQG